MTLESLALASLSTLLALAVVSVIGGAALSPVVDALAGGALFDASPDFSAKFVRP